MTETQDIVRVYADKSIYCSAVSKKFYKVSDILKHVYVIIFNKKTKKHHVYSLESSVWCHKYNYKWLQPNDQIVTFENQDHEIEFIKYHPGVKHLHHAGYGLNIADDSFPIEKRNNRWCWKK